MSRIWRRWKRYRRRGRRHGAIVLALVAVDLTTKAVLVTQPWAWHAESMTWVAMIVVLYGVLTVALISPTAGLLLIAGVEGNALSTLTGAVANPFIIEYVHMAFNLADLYLWIGFALSVALIGRRWRGQGTNQGRHYGRQANACGLQLRQAQA